MLHLQLLLLFLRLVVGNKFALEDINRALEQPDDNRLVPDKHIGSIVDGKLTSPDSPLLVDDVRGAALDGGEIHEYPNVVTSTATILDAELASVVEGKIEGRAEKQLETTYVKRKPQKDTTIWTSVTPKTACTEEDGCCPEDVVTVTSTSTLTSEDLFVYTVTETIDVTIFRGESEYVTEISTTTKSLVLTSTIRREATITTTSFLTTSVPITRIFIRTSRSYTPAIRTVFRNTSTTSTRFATITERSEEVSRDSGSVTLTDTSYGSTRFETVYNTFTQTVFNPITIVDVTVFSFNKITSTFEIPLLIPVLANTSRVTIDDTFVYSYFTTLATRTSPQLDIYTTTSRLIVDTASIATTFTYSRL